MERRIKKNQGVTNHLKAAKAAYAAKQVGADNVPVPWRILFATGSFASSATGTGKVKQECDHRTSSAMSRAISRVAPLWIFPTSAALSLIVFNFFLSPSHSVTVEPIFAKSFSYVPARIQRPQLCEKYENQERA